MSSQPIIAVYDPSSHNVYTDGYSGDIDVINGSSKIATLHVGSIEYYAAADSTHGYVDVPNSGFNNVTLVKGTAIFKSVKVGSGPVAVVTDSENGLAYVLNKYSDNVTILNGSRVVGWAPTGSGPFSGIADPSTGLAYVANSNTDDVTVFNGTASLGSVPTGSNPEFPAYDPENGWIYVPNWYSSNVSIINGTSVVGSVPAGTDPVSAFYDARNGYVYVINLGPGWAPVGNVTVINGTTVVGTVDVGNSPYFGVADPVTGLVYVSNYGDNTVSILNGTREVGAISVGAGPYVPAYDPWNGDVYVPSSTGSDVTVITRSYEQTFGEQGLPNGTDWAVTLGASTLSSNSSTIHFELPNGSYQFAVRGIPGWRPSPGTGNLVVNGSSVALTIVWSIAVYPIWFNETGLPLGTSWTVNLSGLNISSSVGSVEFSEANGTYAFEVGEIPGWQPNLRSGSLVINGSGAVRSILWSQVVYGISFTEEGLPSGTTWSVTVGNLMRSSTSVQIIFSDPNGSYSYVVSGVPGWTTTGYVGSTTVSGAPDFLSVSWNRTVYQLVFSEAGLPSGSQWWVNLTGGSSGDSTSTSLAFAEPNGSYEYWATPLNRGYPQDVGLVTVVGAGSSVSLRFIQVEYALQFSEVGLPPGTNWSVEVNSILHFSNTTEISWLEPNGTFAYNVSTVGGWATSNRAGVVTISGSPDGIVVEWTRFTYSVSFWEAGLPNGTSWTAELDGTVHSGLGELLFGAVPNGTHYYSVPDIDPFAASPNSSTFDLNGSSLEIHVTFQKLAGSAASSTGPPGSGFSIGGLPDADSYALLALGVVGAAVLILLGVRRTRSRGRSDDGTAEAQAREELRESDSTDGETLEGGR